MSDRAIPRSLRMMEGFGVHTYRFLNAKGKSTYVKFHWKPVSACIRSCGMRRKKSPARIPTFTAAICGSDRKRSVSGVELGVQTFDDATADSFAFDVLDPTS